MKKEEENCPNYQKIEVIFVLFLIVNQMSCLKKTISCQNSKKIQTLFSVFNIIIHYIILMIITFRVR